MGKKPDQAHPHRRGEKLRLITRSLHTCPGSHGHAGSSSDVWRMSKGPAVFHPPWSPPACSPSRPTRPLGEDRTLSRAWVYLCLSPNVQTHYMEPTCGHYLPSVLPPPCAGRDLTQAPSVNRPLSQAWGNDPISSVLKCSISLPQKYRLFLFPVLIPSMSFLSEKQR